MNVLLCLIGILFFALIVNYFVGHSRLLHEGLTSGSQNMLLPGKYLTSGKYLVSENKEYFAIMQSDGNFVVYKGSGPTDNKGATWNSDTEGNNESFVIMQDDGNLVVYKGSGPTDNKGVTWNSDTEGNNESFVIMQDDGNLVVYKGTGPTDNKGATWSSQGGKIKTPALVQSNSSGSPPTTLGSTNTVTPSTSTKSREGNQGGGNGIFSNPAYLEKLDKEAEQVEARVTREENKNKVAPTSSKSIFPGFNIPDEPGTSGFKPSSAPPANDGKSPPPAPYTPSAPPKPMNDGKAPPASDGKAPPASDGKAPPASDGKAPPPPPASDGKAPPPPPSNDGKPPPPPPPPPSNDGGQSDKIAVHYSNRTFMF